MTNVWVATWHENDFEGNWRTNAVVVFGSSAEEAKKTAEASVNKNRKPDDHVFVDVDPVNVNAENPVQHVG
jgi:hypothetical protein